jgi:hypothetical protein
MAIISRSKESKKMFSCFPAETSISAANGTQLLI